MVKVIRILAILVCVFIFVSCADSSSDKSSFGNGGIITPLAPQIVDISAGAEHTLALTKDGNVYAWGYNEDGKLGNGDLTAYIVRTPTLIPRSAFDNESVVSIYATDYNSYAITTSGKLYSWGFNSDGQLGINSFESKSTPQFVDVSGEKVKKIAVSGSSVVASTTNGKVYGWGYSGNSFFLFSSTGGRLLTPTIYLDTFASYFQPVSEIYDIGINYGNLFIMKQYPSIAIGLLGSYAGIKHLTFSSSSNKVAAGYSHAIIFSGNNVTYSWGNNTSYQLTDNVSTDTVYDLRKIEFDFMIKDMAVSSTASFAISASGQLYSWGGSASGALGQGENISLSKKPVIISDNIDGKVIKISAGYDHAFAITDKGKIYAWGNNEYGQLGFGDNGTGTERYVPTLLNF